MMDYGYWARYFKERADIFRGYMVSTRDKANLEIVISQHEAWAQEYDNLRRANEVTYGK